MCERCVRDVREVREVRDNLNKKSILKLQPAMGVSYIASNIFLYIDIM